MNAVAADELRWWQYIGPWPLRPWVVFFGIGAVNLIATSSSVRQTAAQNLPVFILHVLLPSLAASCTVAALLWVASRFFADRTPGNLTIYFIVVLLSAAISVLAKDAAGSLMKAFGGNELSFFVPQTLRSVLWSTFLLAVAGVTVHRLSQQRAIAEAALAVSQEQQQLMLINEERSRRQVALLLHDRVQAGLMTACLELRLAAHREGGADIDRIDEIIAKLDELRGMDVRQAARTLSPDLSNVDLHTALTELARNYEPGMTISISIAPAVHAAITDVEGDVLLACYRIAEQGLLNALVHGSATACTISITMPDPGTLSLDIVDNGASTMSAESEPGFGTAIVDAWCRVLDGTWRLDVSPERGASLSAELPIRSTLH